MLRNRKSDLDRHRPRLEKWRREVPRRAERFHRQLEAAQQEIGDLQNGWWPWLGQSEAQQVEQRVTRLANVAGTLQDLIVRATRLGERVAGLHAPESDLEPPTLGWLGDRCRQWTIRLEDLGRHSDRPTELRQEEQILKEMEVSLAQHERAVCLLTRSWRVARLLEGLQATELELELRRRGESLVQDGPSEVWVERLTAHLVPFEEAVAAIRSPPPKLQSATALLNELRGWARHLDAMAEVEKLEERRGFIAVEWVKRDPSEIDQLEQQARVLLERFTDDARRLRQDRLERLEKEMQDFFRVCERHPGLEERLNQLREAHRRLDRSQMHPKWLDQHEKEISYFKAIVENYQPDLLRWLGTLSDGLDSGSKALRGMPLSEDVKSQLREVEYEVQGLRRLESVEEVLEGLQKGRAQEQRLEAISEQAQREVRELADLQQRLIDRQQTLEQLAGAVAFSMEDLKQTISSLDDGTRPLEEAQREADSLAGRLHDEERRCIEHCRAITERRATQVERSRALLERAGDLVEEGPELTIPEGVSVAEAVQTAGYVDDHLRGLEQALEVRLAEARERISRRSAVLREISPATLGPGDRAEVEEVLELMSDGLGGEHGATFEQLELLLDLLEQADILTGQLKREEIEIEQAREALLHRWRKFKNAHLRRYLPEASARIEALIHGLPETLGQPADIRAQLDRADSMLRRLDHRARRLAARDVEVALETIRDKVAKEHDPASREKIAEILAQVDRLEHRQLPPPTLRLRIRGLARETQEGIG